MISMKCKYGLKAIMHIAKQKDYVHISEVSKEEHIPHKFLQGILVELKNHGLLLSRKGKEGGYKLNKDAGDITFGEVIRILDGPIAPILCASERFYKRCEECVDEETCSIRKIMRSVRDRTAFILDNQKIKSA
jgi:Rrf2 family protein